MRGSRYLGLCAVLIAVVLIVPAPATVGAELQGLQEWLSLPDDEREASYPFVRCAGLDLAVLAYAGTERLGEKTSQEYREMIVDLSLAAGILRADKTGGGPLDYQEKIRAERERISQLYVDRMYANYAATGQAIMNDSLIKSDLTLCKQITEKLYR